MPVFLTRNECRDGFWHVVTYNITDPDNWVEVEDISTPQPCGENPNVISIARLSTTEARRLGLVKGKKKDRKPRGEKSRRAEVKRR